MNRPSVLYPTKAPSVAVATTWLDGDAHTREDQRRSPAAARHVAAVASPSSRDPVRRRGRRGRPPRSPVAVLTNIGGTASANIATKVGRNPMPPPAATTKASTASEGIARPMLATASPPPGCVRDARPSDARRDRDRRWRPGDRQERDPEVDAEPPQMPLSPHQFAPSVKNPQSSLIVGTAGSSAVPPGTERRPSMTSEQVGERWRRPPTTATPTTISVGKSRVSPLSIRFPKPPEVEQTTDGHEADERDRRDPDPADDGRHRERHLDPPEALTRGEAHARRRVDARPPAPPSNDATRYGVSTTRLYVVSATVGTARPVPSSGISAANSAMLGMA